ncbi:MAG: PAS domain S-box protein [Streptosporangiales bacterium]|nr:PAS domain S-box protein [Streptosporangiales bacterium]
MISRAVLDSAANAVIAVDHDLTVLEWNGAAERLFGWTADQVRGHPLPIVPEDLLPEFNGVLERVRDGGQLCLTTRRRCRDGSLVDVHLDSAALRGADGDQLGWVDIYREVGDQAASQHHAAARAHLVKRLNDLVADINAELDLPAALDRISQGVVEVTGADAGGFVLIEGDQLRLASFTGLPEKLRGRTSPLRTSLVGELLRGGRTVMIATVETRQLDELIWAELPGLHTIALSLSHVRGRPYGALYALFAAPVSHVELELLELLAGHASVALTNAVAYEEVVRQRAHERAVIDASADGMAVLDGDGLVRQWNPSAHKLTGVPPDKALGKPLPFPLPVPGTNHTHRLDSGRWVEILCSEIVDTRELVVDFRDVTAAKALEEAKDLFLATSSHELRTPITVVQGFARTLVHRWDKLNEADRRSAVQIISDRADALARLVEHLLLGSRAGADELVVHNAPFDTVAVVRAAALAFRSLSEAHTLALEIPEELPQAYGDPLATDIALGQLLENAFKYSPDGGEVAVRVRAEDEWLVVTVADEGVGIVPGDYERIFDRFVQGEGGDRRRFGGIGLGLYIVRRLARAQHGDVSAHPREGGSTKGGTEMRLWLRRADVPQDYLNQPDPDHAGQDRYTGR